MNTLHYGVDAEGVATVTLDAAGKPMNVVSPEFIAQFTAAVDKAARDSSVRGVIVTSAKPAFMAGADLKHMLGMMQAGLTERDAYAFSQTAQRMHRQLETCGKPVVAALNGLALGGGYELALACHYRVIVDDPRAIVGLPEVTVGLLPGSGGTQRLPRLIGLDEALAVMLDGKTPAPAEALRLGMVDAVVSPAELLPTARAWILGSPDAVRPWDRKGYRAGRGLLDPAIASTMAARTAAIASRTQHNDPAPITILSAVFEGSVLPIDKALALESKLFARLLTGPVARNLIRTSFVHKNEAAKLARRPEGVPGRSYRKVGVLGAGMMGSGIACVAAQAGLDVVLLDSSIDLARNGKAYSAKVLDKAVGRGKRTREQADAVLGRIVATTDYALLQDCDLVVEAVFENTDIKADVTRRAEAVLQQQAIFASNTSTLPISQLAQASARPDRFIGLHFFSPVDRMPLVEVIVGERTSDRTLAEAMDFVARLRMIPIVVNDSRGFYTSRVFQTFIHEGMKLLEDGVEPALVENAAKQAGLPVGPLALIDETTLELPWKIVQEAIAAEGDGYRKPCSYEVMRRMIEEFERPGRKYGKGFYEYRDGRRGGFWAGLSAAFPPAARQPTIDEVRKRLLYIQALETARCLEEGVLRHPADGDIGALLGWGFPAWTGGTLSLIETIGLSRFVDECEAMAATLGPRFVPPGGLKDRARSGRHFYA
ncbi:MAG: 3-hydroxyacyl-CoA dehydrogenase NAD-binding domain-containing protein [Pseudomonadota bacterium]|nr:3-hydroxyacyl-CoA dehydrogenase NAD-binding domain-containing protein [Pseudomonadota bacterium]